MHQLQTIAAILVQIFFLYFLLSFEAHVSETKNLLNASPDKCRDRNDIINLRQHLSLHKFVHR